MFITACAGLLTGVFGAEGLNSGGVFFMTVSIGAVLTLVIWCYRRILRASREQ